MQEDTPNALRFGAYRVLRELGRGGVARVYEAEHVQLGRRVAIKAVEPRHAGSSSKGKQLAARLLREGRSTVLLRHPHIVDVYDIGEEAGVSYLVLELVEGGALSGLLERRGQLEIPELIALFLPLAAAVQHSHDRGVVHRDLKPENVLLGVDAGGGYCPKLSDFGVCRSLERSQDEELTRDGGLVGTLSYMAPEQLRAPKLAGPAADQYALGVMLYRAATGQLPFTESDPVLLMQRIATAEVVSPSALVPSLPPGFAELVLRAMARDAAERFPSVRALAEALLRYASGKTWSTWAGRLSATAGAQPPSSADSGVFRAQGSSTWSDSRDSSVGIHEAPGAVTPTPTPRRRSLSLASVPLAVAATLLVTALWSRERPRPVATPGGGDRTAPTHHTPAPPPLGSVAVVESTPPVIVPTAAAPRAVVAPRRAPPSKPERPAERPTVNVKVGRNGAPILE